MSVYPPEKHLLKNGTEVIIRSITANDVESVVSFMKSVFETSEFLATKSSEFNPDIKDEIQSFEKYAHAQSKLLLLASVANDVIGIVDFSNYSIKRRSHAGSLDIFIKQDFRNQGVGKLLLGILIKWAKQVETLERLELTVLSENTNAISLYKKVGFIEEGRKTKAVRYSSTHYMGEIFMALSIQG